MDTFKSRIKTTKDLHARWANELQTTGRVVTTPSEDGQLDSFAENHPFMFNFSLEFEKQVGLGFIFHKLIRRFK